MGLPSSMAHFVPCVRLLQKAHLLQTSILPLSLQGTDTIFYFDDKHKLMICKQLQKHFKPQHRRITFVFIPQFATYSTISNNICYKLKSVVIDLS